MMRYRTEFTQRELKRIEEVRTKMNVSYSLFLDDIVSGEGRSDFLEGS